MNRICKILCGIACVFAFCFLAIGYASVQDDLYVDGSVSVPAGKIYAVYSNMGTPKDYSDDSLFFFFDTKPTEESTIKVKIDDHEKEIPVTEFYVDFDRDTYEETGKDNNNQVDSDQVPWYKERSYIRYVYFQTEVAPISTAWWFNNCTNLTEVIGIENLDTSNVTDMFCMFADCRSLTSLDVSGFETKNVKNMRSMFYKCSSLTELDVSGFHTENVENMHGMFSGCSKLTELDLSSFNTQNVTDMSQMFMNDSSLKTIYASSSFVTTKVADSDQMFDNCIRLKGEKYTTYTSSRTDATYACFEEVLYFDSFGDPYGKAGYFTKKSS